MNPPVIDKMLAVPGIYLVAGAPGMTGSAPVVVTSDGKVYQLKVDGELRPGLWSPLVVVRGPLNHSVTLLEADDAIYPSPRKH